MSHFSVVVCIDDQDGKLAAAAQIADGGAWPDGKDIPAFGGNGALLPRLVNDRLSQILAPWDENLEMEPYRDYEKGDAADHWLYRSLKRAAEDHANGTGILPYEPDGFGWSSSSSKKTPDEQRAEIKAEAELFATLPDPVTWADLARVYAGQYGDEESPLLADEAGRGYTMSTYNPESKWDWWSIGGSWAGYFVAVPGASKRVIAPVRNHRSDNVIMPGRCDGGMKADLDLDALRKAKAAEAVKTRSDWLAAVEGTPEAMSWKSFADNIGTVPGYTIDRAREEYHSQPRIQALRETDFRWHDDPVAEFEGPEKIYVAKAMARAVPGYAVVTADGRWMAPGRMGWWAMSTDSEDDRIGYWEAANAYIEALPAETFLVAIDCHI